MKREKWKATVKGYIYKYALNELNEENTHKKKTSHHPEREKLETQEYFSYLPPADARLYFAVRCGIVDLKTQRKYKYDEDDRNCRLCENEDETLCHVVNKCEKITRTGEISDVFSLRRDDVIEVVRRMKMFASLVEKSNTESEE